MIAPPTAGMEIPMGNDVDPEGDQSSADSLRVKDWEPRYSAETGDPLHDFYIPALKRSVAYDRKAGYFCSTALAVAMEGVVKLAENGGKMRLLVGICPDPEDVRVIDNAYKQREQLQKIMERRLRDRILQPRDGAQRDRMSLLSWMIVGGHMDIKVALPLDEAGRPISSEAEEGIFHEKVGIFTDNEGNQLVFSGSINESEGAWRRNVESFHVYRSWGNDARHAQTDVEEFETLWEGGGRRTIVYDFPDAVREKLLEIAPPYKPDKDPFEQKALDEEATLRGEAEKWAFQFLRDAPYFQDDGEEGEPTGLALAASTSAVTPWPNQDRTIREVLEAYPQRFLLCDEVGLGKTIEAGLVLRTLLLTDTVQRCLLLVPGGLVTQWQEEMLEKFNLNIPCYTGKSFMGARGEEWQPSGSNQWASEDIFIASSHLAKRMERQPQLLQAPPWDLVVVDEAHHARRGSPGKDQEYNPNHLLRLLRELRHNTDGMLLLTATPMQIDVVELWDLLVLLGMGGKWAAARGRYLKDFFTELSEWPHADADLLFDMVGDYLENGGDLDQTFAEETRRRVGSVFWQRLSDAAEQGCAPSPFPRGKEKAALSQQFLTRHTPLRRYMQRSTRDLLRRYRERGLIRQKVPSRDVEDVFIPFTEPEEKDLYERIEEYITDYWRKAERDNNKGLGFVMTIYRQRLTSSLYAVRRSLQRRLTDLVRGIAVEQAGLTGEDKLDEEVLDRDDIEEILSGETSATGDVDQEIQYLQDFIRELEDAPRDSKFDRFVDDLNEQLRVHSKAIIFTQYGDTMHYLRRQLRPVFGTDLACYSGDGGEYWDGSQWARTSKEDIKNRFAATGGVKILLCTDAASEGLNLQTCGLLFNWDMPWNPMRVEQRIGRLDRIGQKYDEVKVFNYFYDESVEAKIYGRLGERIDLFEVSVGKLQPILARVSGAIKEAAKAERDQRDATLDAAVDDLISHMEEAEMENLDIETYVDQEVTTNRHGSDTPVTTAEIEEVFTGSDYVCENYALKDREDGLYEMSCDGEEILVTFDPDTYDTYSDTARFLTYGDAVFEEILEDVSAPESELPDPLFRVTTEDDSAVGYYRYVENDTSPVPVVRMRGLLEELEAVAEEGAEGAEIPEAVRLSARVELQEHTEHIVKDRERRRAERIEARMKAIRAEAEDLLWERTAIDLAARRAANPDDKMALTTEAESLLRSQIQARQQPYPPLMRVTGKTVDQLRPPVDRLKSYFGQSKESLRTRRGRVTRSANELFEKYKEIQEKLHGSEVRYE